MEKNQLISLHGLKKERADVGKFKKLRTHEDLIYKVEELSLSLLEHKYRYHQLDRPIISDYEYDMLEREYEKACDELGVHPAMLDAVGWPENHPNARYVIDKVTKK